MLRRKRAFPGKEGGVTSLAEEINAIYASNVLHAARREPVACKIRCCLDFAAARGMRGSRGKSACYCGCQGKAGRQMLPGDGVVEGLPEGNDLEAWEAAQAILRAHCSYGSELMSYTSLRDAVLVPPLDHDFASGPWVCRHCNRSVFASRAEFDSAKAALAELKERGRSGDADTALTEYNKIMRDHADGHLDQSLYVEPVLDAATDIFVVDPLHSLQLNLMKVAYKYSYMDKMNDSQRERATAYMESIDCFLDLSAKGARNPKQKWMTGAAVDNFEMDSVWWREGEEGTDDDQPPPPQPPPSRALGPRRRRLAPTVGFVTGAPADEADIDLSAMDDLEGGDDETVAGEELRSYLRKKYGNFAANVLKVLLLWEAAGKLFAAWREDWTSDLQDYRAEQSMRFLRAAIEFSFAPRIMSQTIGISHVPQQLFMYGNTWRFSTCAIESRGARLKRIGKRVICWRPISSAMGTVYNCIDRRTQLPVRKTRSYASSPMEQMMIRICNQEVNWHDTSSTFARPKQLRLKQQLRACKLKCEFADELPLSVAVCMLQALWDQVS
eukprot:6212763-Pleurochrysis_carterae.AAC.3